MSELHTSSRRLSVSKLRAGVSVFALLIAGIALPSGAWAADGGYGGTDTGVIGGLPGTDGDAASAHGKDGGPAASYSGGGGGGTNLTTGQGAAGGRRALGGVLATGAEGATGVTGATGLANVNTTIGGGIGGGGDAGMGTGGGGVGVTTTGDLRIQAAGHVTGGAGGNGGGLNGGGGGGGVGVFSSANVTIDAGGTVIGGAGSRGGASGGGGGGGAAAILLTGGGTVTNNGTLTGGKGGDGGNYPLGTRGGGGNGAEGVLLTGGGTVINNTGASITGGVAGGNRASLPAPTGGAGIKGANVSVINAGSIAGGGTADAIGFTGGVNSLELQAGSVITGNVVAFSAADSFTLGGDTDSSFDVSQIGGQYQGFGLYEKTGASTWTLTNTTTAVTPWTLTQGVLSVSSDASLGDPSGGLTFNGGTLQVTGTAFTSTPRTITWGVNGGGFDIADAGNVFTLGQTLAGGPLIKLGAGTLVLTADDVFAGGATISAGTLQVGDGGTTGGITGDVANNGALVFNRAGTATYAGAISGTGNVRQAGSGTTILTGSSNYTGTTYITDGTLQVSGGGVVNGTSYTEVGTRLIVTGAGSAFTDTGDLVTGRGVGTATITVNGGGHLTTGRSFLGEGANYSTSSAIDIAVDGAGSVWNSGDFLQLSAAAGGAASLTVSNGGVMTTPGGTVSIGRGGDATALVTGAGSQLLSGDDLEIGTSFNGGTGNGQLTIQDGGFVAASTVALSYNDGVSIGNSGTLTVLGTPGARGVLETATLSKGYDSASAIFDGGVLRASASSTDFISSYGGDYVTIGAGGMFIDTNGFDVTASSALAGVGALTKQGGGTLILSGNNSYAGGTTISAGTLQLGDGGTGGSILGDVVDNGALAFDRSDNMVFDGTISGGGAVVQAGPGTTILTANNSYTGGTTISAGVLQLGDGGTSGSIQGDVTDNGALTFDRSDAVFFTGVISGTGSVSQIGTGTTTLAANNTYSSGTTITNGTLVGSASSFGTGAILDNAALVIDQPADAAFANAINGTGGFIKQGAGRLNYTGTGMLTGPTTVAAGTLAVNGTLAGSAVTVQNGATLGGNGTVGAAIIQPGATIAPGNSIGTLHVNGAFVQDAGSVYQVEVDPNSSASDLIMVNGAATLASGAGLNVVKDGTGDYRLGTTYTVLTATNGVTGTYVLSGNTTTLSPYIGLRGSYDTNNAYLTVVQTGDPATAAQTGNQTETATGTDSLPNTGDVGSAVLNTPDPDATRSAFDQLSGEALASVKGVLISGSLLVRDTTFDRLRDVFCAGNDQMNETVRSVCPPHSDEPTVWVQGFGNWGHAAADGNAASLSQSTGGFLVGVDVPVYDWRVGYFGGFSRTDFDVRARASSGVSDTYHLGMYGGTQWGHLGLRLGAGYSWNNLSTDRAVTVGALSNDLKADYRAGIAQVFGEVGEKFVVDRFTFEPFANLAYVNLRTDGFGETGGDAALTAKANTMEDTFTTLGVRPSTGISWRNFNATARGMVGWRHTFGDVTPSSVVSFAGSDTFTVTGVPIARDAGVVEAGLDFAIRGNITAGLTYGGQFSSRETDNSIRGTVAVTF